MPLPKKLIKAQNTTLTLLSAIAIALLFVLSVKNEMQVHGLYRDNAKLHTENIYLRQAMYCVQSADRIINITYMENKYSRISDKDDMEIRRGLDYLHKHCE